MTPTHKKYMSMVGRLYEYPLTEYQKLTSPNAKPTLVMPYAVLSRGGWYYLQCEVYTNVELYYLRKPVRDFPAKDFAEKAVLCAASGHKKK